MDHYIFILLVFVGIVLFFSIIAISHAIVKSAKVNIDPTIIYIRDLEASKINDNRNPIYVIESTDHSLIKN